MHIKAESWDISIIIIDKVIFLSLSKPKPNLLKRVTKSNNSMFCPLCLLKIEVGVIPVKTFSPSVSSFKRLRHKKEGKSYKLHIICFFAKKSELTWVFPKKPFLSFDTHQLRECGIGSTRLERDESPKIFVTEGGIVRYSTIQCHSGEYCLLTFL